MTPQELAATNLNLSRARRGMTNAHLPGQVEPTGTPNTNLMLGPLGTDPEVIAAFNRMMQDQAQGDDETGVLNRNLQFNIDLSQKDRLKNILAAHQNFADRGTLNSGIALRNDEDVNTLYDQQQRDYENTTQDSIRGIGRRHQGTVNDYNNAGITASHNAELARADAAAAKLKADNDAKGVQDQIAALLAQLSPAASAYVPPPESQVYNPAPVSVYKPPVAKPVVYKPPVIKSPIPKLTLKGPK